MTRINKGLPKLFGAKRPKTNGKANSLCRRWHRLREKYLPVESGNSIWRYSRESNPEEPLQGWKIHVSATILDACDLFGKIAPYLISQSIQFKAPESLTELSNINSGLQYGYHQVGKFITVYPRSEKETVETARQLHELTTEFTPISIPFDEQYLPDSSVFYRYGAFGLIEILNETGEKVSAIKTSTGELVADNRFQAVPDWITDPFRNNYQKAEVETPLTNTYKVFRAITQRGKGGTYHAVDLSQANPVFCIVKEGRRHGEVGWNGQDGLYLVKNEFQVLKTLERKTSLVPRVYSSFEIDDDFYLVMEFIDGQNLHQLMKYRQRRFSTKQVIKFAVEISKIIEKIHLAGWIWNDCKPSNLIVTQNHSLRPIDFEGAYPVNQANPFDWKTKGFSRSSKNHGKNSGKSDDLYAMGTVLYFLLTGNLYNSANPIPMKNLRRNIPAEFTRITEKLLFDDVYDILETSEKLAVLLKSIVISN